MPKLATRTTMPKPNDPAIIARIAEATRKGHPITTAGVMAGLAPRTAAQWREQGEAEWEEGDELGSHVPLMLAVKQAEAELVDSQLDIVQDAGARGLWAAAMTLLERRFPQDFGRNQTVHVKTESLSVVLHGTLPPGAEAELISQAHARLLARGTPQIEAGGGSQD